MNGDYITDSFFDILEGWIDAYYPSLWELIHVKILHLHLDFIFQFIALLLK